MRGRKKTVPLAGSVGAIFAGWMSDRLFQSRRVPVAAIKLFLLGWKKK